MVDLFYNLYSHVSNKNNIWEKTKINSLIRNFIRIACNITLPLYYNVNNFFFTHKIETSNATSGRLIASLTTFPARIGKLWIVIETIMRQKQKPDKLILWLSKDQFESFDEIPSKLQKLQKRGLEIVFCDGDLRSHKKYYYVLKEYPNDHLFTFDDDILYPSNTISSVMESAHHHPNCVIGRYSNHLTKKSNNEIVIDRMFSQPYVNTPSYSTFIGSGGGTFYPQGALPEIATRSEVFMDICKTADDVWLNTMCRFNNYPVVAIIDKCPLIEIYNRRNVTLTSINQGDLNHLQLRKVREFCIANGKDPFATLD